MFLTNPFDPIGSLRFGNFSTSFWVMIVYCSEVGYLVYREIKVRNTCIISLLALDEITPVSIAFCTLHEYVSFGGNWKLICQSDGCPIIGETTKWKGEELSLYKHHIRYKNVTSYIANKRSITLEDDDESSVTMPSSVSFLVTCELYRN